MTRHIDKNNCCWSCDWEADLFTEHEDRVPGIVECTCDDSDHCGHVLSEEHPACEQYTRTE